MITRSHVLTGNYEALYHEVKALRAACGDAHMKAILATGELATLGNVARASLDELLLDYEDFLRQRGLPQWDKDDPQARAVRAVGKVNPTDQSDRTDRTDAYTRYRRFIEEGDAETAANTLICLIHQANYLLDRQIAALEKEFIHEGGYSERLAAARLEARRRKQTDQTERSPTGCQIGTRVGRSRCASLISRTR